MTQGENIEHRRRRAKPGQIRDQCSISRSGDSRLQSGDRKLPIRLPKRHQPHTGRNQIGREGRKKTEGSIAHADALFRRCRAESDRMGKLAWMARRKGRKAWCLPGGQRDAGERRALRFRFQSGFRRAAPGRAQ